MIRRYRPYSVDEGPSSYPSGQAFDPSATGVLIVAGGYATTRFRGIDIPQGSNINSATLRIPWSGKNDVASSFNYTLHWLRHDHMGGTTLAAQTYADPYYWGSHQSGTQKTASRAEGDNTETGRIISVNLLTEFSSFKLFMEGSDWQMHNSIIFSLQCNSVTSGNPDIFFQGREVWELIVDFTPPATPARTEILNHVVNPHAQYSQAYYNPWESNPALGNYPTPPTIARGTMPDNSSLGVASGWQITWPNESKSWVNHWAFNRLEFGKWYTFSAWCYVPTGAPDIFIDFLFQTVSQTYTVKNQWFKISHTFLNTIWDDVVFVGIAHEQTTTMTGPHLYFTKVMFTEGEDQPGYFGGSINQTGFGTAQYTAKGEETRLYLATLSKPTLTAPADSTTNDPAGNLTWTNGGSSHQVIIKRTS